MCLCYNLDNKGTVLYICVVYFRPKSDLEVYRSLFVQINLLFNSHILILGDFNLSICCKGFCLVDGNSMRKELFTFLNMHNLKLENDIRHFQNKTGVNYY